MVQFTLKGETDGNSIMGLTDGSGIQNIKEQQIFAQFMGLSAKIYVRKLWTHNVSAAILWPAVCDIMKKTGMCGKSINYVTSHPFSALHQ